MYPDRRIKLAQKATLSGYGFKPVTRIESVIDGALDLFSLLFIAELILCGALGLYIGEFSVRKTLFFALIFLSISKIIYAKKVPVWYLYITLIVSIVILLWGILIPLVKGTELALSVKESTPLAILLLTVVFYQAIRAKGVKRYAEFANYCLAFVASFMIIVWVQAQFFGDFIFSELLRAYFLIISGDIFALYVGPMPDGSYRVMWITSILIPFAIIYKNRNSIHFAWTLFYLLAILASGTRILLYVAIFSLFFLGARATKAISWFKFLVLVVAFISVFVMLINPDNASRLWEISQDVRAGHPRYEQIKSLWVLFTNNIFLGAGFGAVAEYVRSGFSYEMTYNALLAKLGFTGLLVVFISFVPVLLRAHNTFPDQTVVVALLASAFLLINSTNPYLLNFYGMSVLAFFIAIIYSHNSLNVRKMRCARHGADCA